MEVDSVNRTWLSTIVFTDIVGYSIHSVEEQVEIKAHFNGLVSQAIDGVEESERVVVDTGDGLAVCFLADPENAIVVSMKLREIVTSNTHLADVPYEVRTGIHIGPVRLVTDINQQYNVLGDGINVAQRAMSFAGSRQVLVTRAFYDVAWCLSDTYSEMFQYYGVRKDKHGREHVLYEVHDTHEQDTQKHEPSSEPTMDELTRVVRARLSNDVSPVVDSDWDPEVLRKAENDLAEHVGPLAKVLVRKEAARTLSVEDLYVRLACAVPMGAARSKFLQNSETVLDEATRSRLTEADDEVVVSLDEPAPTPASWPPEVVETAAAHLAPYVGPIAGMLARKAARRSDTLVELYERLAADIQDLNKQDEFLRKRPQ